MFKSGVVLVNHYKMNKFPLQCFTSNLETTANLTNSNGIQAHLQVCVSRKMSGGNVLIHLNVLGRGVLVNHYEMNQVLSLQCFTSYLHTTAVTNFNGINAYLRVGESYRCVLTESQNNQRTSVKNLFTPDITSMVEFVLVFAIKL